MGSEGPCGYQLVHVVRTAGGALGLGVVSGQYKLFKGAIAFVAVVLEYGHDRNSLDNNHRIFLTRI